MMSLVRAQLGEPRRSKVRFAPISFLSATKEILAFASLLLLFPKKAGFFGAPICIPVSEAGGIFLLYEASYDVSLKIAAGSCFERIFKEEWI